MMANNVKQPPIVVMSQINKTSAIPQSSQTKSTKSQSNISNSATQNNVSSGDLQCCGKGFSSSKTFHRHLADAALSDPKHESKLFRLGMRRCSLCPMWIHKNAMNQHIKRNHAVKITSSNSSDTVVTNIQRQQQHKVVGNRITIPNVKKKDQQSVSLGSRGSPGYIIRVSGQPQQFVRVGKPVQQINKVVARTVTTQSMGQKVQFKTASGTILPTTLANTVIKDKNGATVGYKVGGSQIITKTTMSADGMRKLTVGTLGSLRKILPVGKGSELQKQSKSEFSNPEKQDNIVHGNRMSEGKNLGSLAYNEKNNPKTLYKGTNLGKQIVRKNVVGTNISYKVLQQSSETVEITSPVEPNIETSNKKISKKKRKQVLSPSIESVDMVTIDNDNAVDMHPKEKKVKRPPKKQKSTPVSIDNSMKQNDNVTPKNQRKNSKGSKSASNTNIDSLYTPVITSSVKGKGRKKGPGRPRRIVTEVPEPPESNSFMDIKDEYENIENEPEMGKKNCKVEENVPEVELDLFTLPSVNEKQISVFLVEPKNPDFKVYASMDAIFVGDSALGDVTNQLGYITDMNNVVFVSPQHFLFPNVKDIDNFVPRPLLIMKCCKTFQSKPQSSSNENLKSSSPKKKANEDTKLFGKYTNLQESNSATSPALRHSTTTNSVTPLNDSKGIEPKANEDTRLFGKYTNIQESNSATSPALRYSNTTNSVTPLSDSKGIEPKRTDLLSDINKPNKKISNPVASVNIKHTVKNYTSLTHSENKLSNIPLETPQTLVTIESTANTTSEENFDSQRIKKKIINTNTSLSKEIDKDEVKNDHCKEIQKKASNKLSENKSNKDEMVSNHSIKNDKEILDFPGHSLIKSPNSGLRSTKLGLKIPKLVSGLKPIDTDDSKTLIKSVENVKSVNKKHEFPESVKSSLPVIKTDAKIADINLSANSRIDNSEVMNPLKQQEQDISKTKKREEISLTVEQNTNGLSSKLLNNKIDEMLKDTEVLNSSQTSKIDKSNCKKTKALRAFRSKSIDSPFEKENDFSLDSEGNKSMEVYDLKGSLSATERKLSEEDRKVDKMDLTEKEFELCCVANESQHLNVNENLNFNCRTKVVFSSSSEVSNDIKNDSLQSELKESSPVIVDKIENKIKPMKSRRIKKKNTKITIKQDLLEQNLQEKRNNIIDESRIPNLTEDVKSDIRSNTIRHSPYVKKNANFFEESMTNEEKCKQESVHTVQKEKCNVLLLNTTLGEELQATMKLENLNENSNYKGKVERFEEDTKLLKENNTSEELKSKEKPQNVNQISKEILSKTTIKSVGSKCLQNEISITDKNKLNKINCVTSDGKKCKLGSPPGSNRDIRSFFNHDMSSKIAEDTKSMKKAPKQDKTNSNTNLLNANKDDSSEKLHNNKQSKSKFKLETAQETCVHSENNSSYSLDNKESSSFENEKLICLKESVSLDSTSCNMNCSSETLEMNCQNDKRLSSPPTRNCKSKTNIKMTDIRLFFSPENTKKRRSAEPNESCKKAKVKQELDYSQEKIKIKISLKKDDLSSDILHINEADFVGFNGCPSISLQRASFLSEIVNRLSLKHNIQKEEFILPIDQIWCDLDEELLNKIITSR